MLGELGEGAAADDQDGPGAQHEQRAAADLPGGVVGDGQATRPHPLVEPGADDGHPVVQGRLFVAVRVFEEGPELSAVALPPGRRVPAQESDEVSIAARHQTDHATAPSPSRLAPSLAIACMSRTAASSAVRPAAVIR